MLPPMTALVLPVVARGVDHAQIRSRGMIEQLGDLIEGVRIGVVAPRRVRVGDLRGER